MEIQAYWRPKDDTGIGFHYYPDLSHYSKQDLDRWLPELKAMGTSWLVLLSDPVTPLPGFFLKELVDSGIEPVIRVYTRYVGALDLPALRALLEAYVNAGIHYVHVYNEPNLTNEWEWAEWSKPALVDRFMGFLIPCLQVMAEAGLYPVFTPLSPGGNYWDTVFLKTALDYIVLKGSTDLFARMAIGIHNYTFNKPLDWGKGGPSRWPDARPYYCPPGSQDHVGFYLFEWYDAIVRARIGRSLPMICYENGPFVGSHEHSGYPAVDENAHATISVDVTRMLMDGQLPDYVFNNAFWLLRNGEGCPFEGHAWYKSDGRQLKAVDALKQTAHRPRRMNSAPPTSSPLPSGEAKPLFHYVLCPVWEWGVSERYWRLLINYVKAFKPACGFDPNEAAMARYVTIIGRPPGVPQLVEEGLKARGCQVERIAGDDAAETQRVLDELAHQKRRFLTFSGESAKEDK